MTARGPADRLGLLASAPVRSALAAELRCGIEYHASLPSTQLRARELAAAGAERCVVVAEEQTGGLGTHGRSWHAPAGTALLASWLLRPAPDAPALMTLCAGVAVARALASLGVRDAELKWPNDVLLGGRKVAGVLAHGVSDAAGGFLVIGIGVNVTLAAADFPPNLRAPATSLALAGHAVDRLALFVRLTAELGALVEPAARPAALAEWRGRAIHLGRRVRVTRDGLPAVEGVARDLDADGALVVETAYGRERIHAGEVTVEK